MIIMGVAGAGKSTIGAALASALKWTFIDADDYHAAEHIEQMRRGIALTDVERGPWLLRVREAIVDTTARGQPAVVACSALKRRYRDVITRGVQDTRFVYLRAGESLLRHRLATRSGHFAGPALASAQAEALEEPAGDEALILDASCPPQELVDAIRRALRLGASSGEP